MRPLGYDVLIERPEPPGLFDLQVCAQDRAAVERALAFSLPDDSRIQVPAADEFVYRVGPAQWLWRVPLAIEVERQRQLERVTQGRHAMATLMSDAFSVFRVTGRDAVSVLCQGIAIDLDAEAFGAGRATRCGLAKTSALVHCIEPGRRYELLIDRALERYAGRWFRAAAGESIAL